MFEKSTTAASEEKGNVTLRDIARELGISHAAVSLALRNDARISEATRIRVKNKAEEMGYRQDPMLSALSHYRVASKKARRQSVLAWVNSTQTPCSDCRQEEFRLYREGAWKAARRLGFQLEEFSFEAFSPKRLSSLFKSRNIQGIVAAPAAEPAVPAGWNDFPWQDFFSVRFGQSIKTPFTHFVSSAQMTNTMTAFRKIRSKGYQRIGFVGCRDDRRHFLPGYLGGQHVLPREQWLSPLMVDAAGLPPGVLERWMNEEKPDAVLTDIPELPSMLDSLGISIPQDVGIASVSIHDTSIDAGIDQYPEEVGATVIRSVVGLVNEHHFGMPAIRNSILVDGQWVDGSMLPVRG